VGGGVNAWCVGTSVRGGLAWVRARAKRKTGQKAARFCESRQMTPGGNRGPDSAKDVGRGGELYARLDAKETVNRSVWWRGGESQLMSKERKGGLKVRGEEMAEKRGITQWWRGTEARGWKLAGDAQPPEERTKRRWTGVETAETCSKTDLQGTRAWKAGGFRGDPRGN